MASEPRRFVKRADIAATAGQLRLILGAIERGELAATATEAAYITGAAEVMEAFAGD